MDSVRRGSVVALDGLRRPYFFRVGIAVGRVGVEFTRVAKSSTGSRLAGTFLVWKRRTAWLR